MRRLEACYQGLHRVAEAGAWLGGLLLLLSALAITVDILMRKFMSMSLGGASELAGFALAIATAWAYSYCLLQRGHIRITTAWQYLPRGLRVALDMLSNLLLLFFMQFVAWHGSYLALQSFQLGTRSMSRLELPVWIMQGLWATGLVFFCVVSVFLATYALAAARAGDLKRVDRLLGLPTIDEEVEREIRASTRGAG